MSVTEAQMLKPVWVSKVLWFMPSITNKQGRRDAVCSGQDYVTIVSLGVSGIAAEMPSSCPAMAASQNEWTAGQNQAWMFLLS